MLRRRGAVEVPRERMKKAFKIHLERLFGWLHEQPHISVLVINYNKLLDNPRGYAEKVSEFLDDIPMVEAMVQTVEPSLYRNRTTMAQVRVSNS
jgi:hypothetical protein